MFSRLAWARRELRKGVLCVQLVREKVESGGRWKLWGWWVWVEMLRVAGWEVRLVRYWVVDVVSWSGDPWIGWRVVL